MLKSIIRNSLHRGYLFVFQVNHDRDTTHLQIGHGQPLNEPVGPGKIIEINIQSP